MSLDPEVQAHTPVEREGTDGVKKSQAGTKRTVGARYSYQEAQTALGFFKSAVSKRRGDA